MRLVVLLISILLPSFAWALTLQVNIVGVDTQMAASLGAELSIQQAVNEPKVTAVRVHNLYNLAEEQLITTLQAKGYYHSKILENLQHVQGASPEQDTWIATFTIELGEPTKIGNVSLEITGPGKDDPQIQPFLKPSKLVSGKILTHEDYEDTKEKILADFNSVGYLKARFTQHTIEVDRQNYTANIILKLDTGRIYVFGPVKFVDSNYPDSLLQRYVPFKAGDPYTTRRLVEFQQNLEAADLFSKIRFDPTVNLEDPNDLVVPVDVRLINKPKNKYSGSIGYGTDTSFRANLSWLHRLPNTEGHKIQTLISASKIRKLAKVNYMIPGKHAATDRYTIGASVQEEKFDNLYSRKGEIMGNTLIQRGKMRTVYGLNLFTETYRITANDPKYSRKFLLPNATWTWTDSHNNEFYDYGTRLNLRMRGGLKHALSDADVFQTELDGKQIFEVTEKTRLIFRGNVGALATKNFYLVPPSLRFFTGGDYTVRGFAYNSLGPKINPGNPDSDTIGGKYLLVGSGEFERTIWDQVSGVVFIDAGNAMMKFGRGTLAVGAGFGVRYRTPIGNFRVDLAKPLNFVINRHWRLHLNFGTDF